MPYDYSTILTFLGFLITLNVALDCTSGEDFKARLIKYLLNEEPSGIRPIIRYSYPYRLAISSFEMLFSRNFASMKFFLRSIVISLAFISILTAVKCTKDYYYSQMISSSLFSPSRILPEISTILFAILISDY